MPQLTYELIPVTEVDILQELTERDLLTTMVQDAMEQASRSHQTQVRDNGQPYLTEHIFPATLDVVRYYGDTLCAPREETITAAVATLLHDTVEDDPTYSLADCSRRFPSGVVDNVWRLSKMPGEGIPYLQKLEEGSDMVKRIKSADRCNNLLSSVALLPRRSDKLTRYLVETNELYIPLAETLPEDGYATRLRDIVALAEETMLQHAA